LNEYAGEILSAADCTVKTYVEAEISENDITMEIVDEISKLEPYGAKNPEPIFVLRDVRIAEIAPLSMGKHTKLYLDKNDVGISAICFGHNLITEGFSIGDRIDVVCSISINEFRGNKTVQLIVRDVDYSTAQWQEIEDMENHFMLLQNGEYYGNEAIIPKREEFASVYRILKDAAYTKGKKITIMKLAASFPQISHLKIMVILEVFAQCELIVWNKIASATYYIRRLDTTDKKNLFSAPLMKLLTQN
jgi:single-stranded-DNA-specific exonuclease